MKYDHFFIFQQDNFLQIGWYFSAKTLDFRGFLANKSALYLPLV